MDECKRTDPQWSLAGRTPALNEDRTGWMMFHHSGPLQLERLTAQQIDVRDIVHSLGAINRFNGQTRAPISVLWHSLMVKALCKQAGPESELEGLFHDAGEAYVGDWIKPLSGMFGTRLAQLRRSVQQRCFEAAGLENADPKLSPAVHQADDVMNRYELQAPWGYGRTVSWHAGLSNAERARVQRAMEQLGSPSDNNNANGRLRKAFLEEASRLTAATAPIRKSIDEALASD